MTQTTQTSEHPEASASIGFSDPLGTGSVRRPARLTLYLGLALVGIGLVAMYLGYDGAATNPVVAAQIPYVISGGIFGAVLVLLGTGALGAFAVMHSHARMREELIEMRAALERVSQGMAGRAFASPVPGTNGMVMVPDGASSFHAPGCRILERSGDTTPLPREEAERTGLIPCRICKP